MQSTSPAVRTALSVIFLACCLSLTGCSTMKDMFSDWTFGEQSGEEQFEPAESLAAKGMDAYGVGNYTEALQAFNEIMDRYPFSPQAILAELKAADCHYYKKEYVEAKTLYKEFEERHPTNEAIPYVMFQIGMCDFSRTDRIDRDVSGAQEAIQSFNRLLRAHPDSPYTHEARARIRAAKEFLVNHEYFVAVFYVRTKKYEQAQHRLKYILAMYPDSDIIPKAKALLAKLDAGEPPRWGLSKWLPDLTMPEWTLFGDDNDSATDMANQVKEMKKEQK
jgi:outer membrane protein assembly factor BamD